MSGYNKKLFSIAIAFLAGIVVILFAWKGSTFFNIGVSKNTTDKEWKDSLSIIPQESTIQTLANHGGALAYTGSGGATTTTDLLARNLLTSYALIQGNMATTTWSDTDADALAQILVKQIELPQGKQYVAGDIIVSTDNSPTALSIYSKEVSRILLASTASQKEGDTAIVFAVPGKNDAQRKAAIEQLIARYKKLKRDLLAVKTPSEAVPFHLRLVQGYANIGDSIKIMPEIFTDPAKGFAALTQYKNEVAGLIILSKEFQDYLQKTQQ